ncbi:hypothetical protein M758_5G197600 [Ceratodon purpureus]|nr:hypothetical protein M758_5G197600 [Ceratodon purpureus]
MIVHVCSCICLFHLLIDSCSHSDLNESFLAIVIGSHIAVLRLSMVCEIQHCDQILNQIKMSDDTAKTWVAKVGCHCE